MSELLDRTMRWADFGGRSRQIVFITESKVARQPVELSGFRLQPRELIVSIVHATRTVGHPAPVTSSVIIKGTEPGIEIPVGRIVTDASNKMSIVVSVSYDCSPCIRLVT